MESASAESFPSAKFGNDLDTSHDIRVQTDKFRSGDPIFTMNGVSNHVDLVSIKKFVPDAEAQHISSKARALVLRIPVTCNLRRIILIEDGVEEGLFGQSRRKLAIAACAHEIEFFLAYRPIERG
jgi:hypothetical protein